MIKPYQNPTYIYEELLILNGEESDKLSTLAWL